MYPSSRLPADESWLRSTFVSAMPRKVQEHIELHCDVGKMTLPEV